MYRSYVMVCIFASVLSGAALAGPEQLNEDYYRHKKMYERDGAATNVRNAIGLIQSQPVIDSRQSSFRDDQGCCGVRHPPGEAVWVLRKSK